MAFKIGRYLMAVRQDSNIDPDALAGKLRIERSMLNNWELDVSHPNIDALLAVAAAMDVDVRRLIGLKTTTGRSLFHPFAKKDALQWEHQGSERRQVALSIVLTMAAEEAAKDEDIHAALVNYYEQLIQEKDTRTDMVINANNIRLGQALGKTQVSDTSRDEYNQLLQLAMDGLRGK
ncbi:helix-turn-helix domain-containing protein [Lacticaseibacillus sharpeae]|nr:helix-turn-helix transcriptional regulator [Lacticaseibacillus sharpeae]